MVHTFLIRAVLVVGVVAPPPLVDSLTGEGWQGFLSGAQAQIYVDCSATSNGTGTLAAPYNTLSSLPGTLGNNATVLIARGCRCDGTIAVNGDNVTIGDYGTGPLPVISGSSVVPDNAWTWDATCQCHTATVPNATKYVYRNGALLTKARTPNANAPEPWFRNNFHNGATLLGSSSLTGFTQAQVENGTAVIRAHNWTYKSIPIVDISTTGGFPAIQLATNLSDVGFVYNLGYENWGFFMEGKRAFLDRAGEWCWEDGTIYLKTTGETDLPTGIRVATREFGVSDASPLNTVGLTIHNIAFEHQWGAGVETYVASTTNIHDCDFTHLYRGIKDQSGSTNTNDGHRYQDNTFTDVYDVAILSDATNVQVLGNDLLRIGMVPGLGSTDYGGYQGIRTAGSGVIVRDNRLDQIGYTGIEVQGGGVVEHNFVNAALSTLNDGGGISFDLIDPNLPFPALRVANNICQGIADPSPTLVSTASLGGDGTITVPYTEFRSISFGIYFGDKQIVNTLVTDNTINGYRSGIHVDHSLCSQGNVVQHNVLYDNDINLSLTDYSNYQDYDPDCAGNGNNTFGQGTGSVNYQDSYDTRYERNVLYSPRPGQLSMRQANVWAGNYAQLVRFGTFMNNIYYNPFTEIIMEKKLLYASVPITNYIGRDDRSLPFTLQSWGLLSDQDGDQSGRIHPQRLPSYQLLAGSPVVPVAIHSDECNAIGIWNNASFFTGDGSDGGYLRFTGQNFIERWGLGLGSITPIVSGSSDSPPGTYRFTLRARSSDTYALQLGPVYSTLDNTYKQPISRFGLSPIWTTTEQVLEVPAGNNMVTAFQNVQRGFGAQTSSVVDIDYVRVEIVTLDDSYANNIAADHLLRYNCPLTTAGGQNAGASFTVPGDNSQCWSDVFGNFYAGGEVIDLDEWESIVLFKYDGLDPSTLVPANGVYTVTGTQTITESQNIQGRIKVPDGATLIVDGATLGFAVGSELSPADIVVEAGGTLELINGATLTNWQGCNGPAEGLWAGVKVQGSNGSVEAGKLIMNSGATISRARMGVLTGLTQGGAGGGEVSAENAVFMDNEIGVYFNPVNNAPADDFNKASFTACTFSSRGELPGLVQGWRALVMLRGSQSAEFLGCTFKDNAPVQPGESRAVRGIIAQATTLKVQHGATVDARGRFSDLASGVEHSSPDGSRTFLVDRTDFIDCERAVLSTGTDNQIIVRNRFEVAGFHRPTGTFSVGVSLHGATGFEITENEFLGKGDNDSPAEVGLVLTQCGPAMNRFYNNRFNGFKGNTPGAGFSAGTIVRGINSNVVDPDSDDGLEIKCNDYSTSEEGRNAFDIAFTASPTQPQVTIAAAQGSGVTNTGPAGNTFAFSCSGNEDNQHMYEADNAQLNTVSYVHHDPTFTPNIQLVPECRTISSLSTEGVPELEYTKETACPFEVSIGFTVNEEITEATDAANEFDVLKEVYDDWKDGGNTASLIAFINDLNHTSYQVRNQLMLAAPKVSSEAWTKVFARPIPLSPWHLAQALVANSPLEPKVLDMLDRHPVEPFYKELVEDAQNGGVSMHQTFLSEMAHFRSKLSRSSYGAASKVILGQESSKKAQVLTALSALQPSNAAQLKLALHLATADLVAARSEVDLQRSLAPDNGYWKVQDLWLEHKEQALDPWSASGSVLGELQAIAAAGEEGAPEADAWLELLGVPFVDDTELPNVTKRRKEPAPRAQTNGPNFLQAYPNPASGPVYLTYSVVEGVDNATIEVYTEQGQMLMTKALGNNNGIAELQTQQWAPGVHVAVLYFDGLRIGSTKMNVVR